MLDMWLSGILGLLQFKELAFLALGMVIGLFFGAIPGLGGAAALALLMPLTYGLEPFTALALSTSPVPPFGFALEGYAFADARSYAARDGGVRGAVTLTPRPWLVFDFGGDVGWFPSTHAFSLFFGVTVIPAIVWTRSE